jgi:ATP-dependent Clp protease ATP-binding subunit ClpA
MIYARQDILGKIERAFKERKGVLLVGEPGAGKSWIARSFVEHLVDGKLCRFIKDPQVFACGASKFKSDGGASLDEINSKFQRYKDQVVFFFDEFHALFKSDGIIGNKADEVKLFCEDFKYVIGATTTDEYDKYVKDQTAIIDRRFVVVKVGKLEDKKINTVLSNYLKVHHPTIKLDEKVIDYIIKKANEFNSKTSKIDAAQSLLNRAIKEMGTVEFPSLEGNIDQLEDEKSQLEQQLLNCQLGQDQQLVTNLKAKNEKIDQNKQELEKKNAQVKRIKKIENYLLKLRQESFQMADPSLKLTDHPYKERKWLEIHTKMKVIGGFLDKQRKDLSLPIVMDPALIDNIIKERKG